MSDSQNTNSVFSTINRIQSEPKLFENDNFFIVSDAEPVVHGHLLVLSKENKHSFSDCVPELLASFLEGDFLKDIAGVDYYFIERGRASFCSSFDNFVHAHAHLVPVSAVGIINPSLSPITQHSHLITALNALKGCGEYLLWGRLSDPFFVANPLGVIEKRFIRKMLLHLKLHSQ